MNATVGLGIAITLADMFTPKLNNAEKGVGRFVAKLSALSTASVVFRDKLTGKLTQTYEAFADTAQKQGDLMSLGMDTKGMDTITQKGIEFANTWSGVVTKDFLGAAYDIKSGISSLSDEGVAEMTRYALLTGKATKSSAETMSKLFALGHGIFRDDFGSDFEFGKQFSASIAATVQLFRTDGDDLARGMSTLGAVAKKFGVSLTEELTVLGMSKSSFDSAAEGATSYKAFLMGAVKSQKKLGLTFTDSNGKLLPMVDILEKIKKKFGKLDAKEIALLKEALGSDEAVKIVTALIDKTDDMRNSQEQLNKAKESGLNYTKAMAESREYGQEMRLLSEQAETLSMMFGKALAPAMKWVSTKLGKLVLWAQKFTTEHKEMASNIATGMALFAGLATTLGTIGVAVAGVTFGLKMLGGGLALINPVTLGITAFAALAYLVYDNWEMFSTYWGGIWDKITKYATNGIETIKETWSGVLNWFEDMFNKISGYVSKITGFAERVKTAIFGDDVSGSDARLKTDRKGPALKSYNLSNTLAAQVAALPVTKNENKTITVNEGNTHVTVNIHGKNDDEIVRKVKDTINRELLDKKDRSVY